MKVSIIVPVYNEQKSVRTTIELLKRVMQETDYTYEIIAVNDGSHDSSGKILDSIKGIKVLRHNRNKGYSSSLKTGIKESTGDVIAITDADGTYPVEEIPALLKFMGNFDMVVGARIGKRVAIPFSRKPAKWILGKIANYIAGRRIPDINSGLRVFKKDLALEFWKILPERFSFTITITLASITSGYDIKFVPINYYVRQGKSTIHPIKDFLSFGKIITRMMLFFRPLKIFIPLSIFIFILGLLILAIGFLYFNQIMDATFLLFTMFSVQFFALGLIAEMIANKVS